MVTCPPLPKRSCSQARSRQSELVEADAQSSVEVGGSGGSSRDGVLYVVYVVEADVLEDALTRRREGGRRTTTTTTTTTNYDDYDYYYYYYHYY